MTIDQAGPYKGTFLPDPVEDIVVPVFISLVELLIVATLSISSNSLSVCEHQLQSFGPI